MLMEVLYEWGWALLIIAVVLGSLFALGFFGNKPSSYSNIQYSNFTNSDGFQTSVEVNISSMCIIKMKDVYSNQTLNVSQEIHVYQGNPYLFFNSFAGRSLRDFHFCMNPK